MINYGQQGSYIVTANQQIVDDLLERNVNNRRVKPKNLDWIRRAINAGKFCFTGQSISVSRKGQLIDGQHRLLALRDCGYPPVQLLIVTGLEDEANLYVDQNVARSTTDILTISSGRKVNTRVAAPIKMLLSLRTSPEGDVYIANGKPLMSAVMDTLDLKGELIESLLSAGGPICRAGVIVALIQYAEMSSLEKASDLAIAVRDGVNLSKEDPAYRLREYLISGQIKKKSRDQRLSDYKMTISACVAHANQETLVRLRETSNWPRRLYHTRAA